MYRVFVFFTLLALNTVNVTTLAAEKHCTAKVNIPAGWSVSNVSGKPIYKSPYGFASLIADCSVLPKTLTDIEFAYHIGMEEVEEGGGLKTFGSYRGQSRTLDKYKSIEWWLKKDNFKVHLVLQSNNGSLPGDLEEEVNGAIKTLIISTDK